MTVANSVKFFYLSLQWIVVEYWDCVNLVYNSSYFQKIGETALHRAVLYEPSRNLHVVDFLIQNMTNSALDKQTSIPASSDISGGNTALHLCALFDKVESMKLLLRSGTSTTIRNSQNKTPMDIAQELGHHTCIELVRTTCLLCGPFLNII